MKRRHTEMAVAVLCTVFVFQIVGCAPTSVDVRFSGNPSLPSVNISRLPLRAALIVAEALKGSISEQTVTCPTLVNTWVLKFPVGEFVTDGAEKMLSQAFESVKLVADRDAAIGQYDVLIEVAPPVLTIQSDCTREWIFLPLFPVAPYQFFGRPGGATAQVELSGKITDSLGRTVLAEASFKTAEGLNIPLGGPFSVKEDVVGAAVEKEIISPLGNLIRSLLTKPQLQQYAQAFQGRLQARKEKERGEQTAPGILTSSDVDRLPQAAPATSKNRHAIVIGIEQYRQKLPKADFAVHDAEIVGQYLTKAMGYAEENVVVLLNDHAARTDLEKYIEKWLPNRVEKGDSVFIYFSGHGAPNPKTGDAYLVPYDGDPSYVDTTGYPLKRLYENLAKLPAKDVVVLLDSCFSGAGGRSVVAKGMRPMVLSIETAMSARGKTVVLAASSGDQVSSTYDAKGHGLLTYYFLKGLQGEADKNQDGSIEVSELFEYVKPQVERVARREFNNEQTPQLLGSPEMLSKGVRLIDRTRP